MKTFKAMTLLLYALSSSAALASENTQSVSVGGMPSESSGQSLRVNQQDNSKDALFGRLLHMESRGKQFNNEGHPLTSVKGAVGVAQIMPETAPEAARLAGLEWDHWRYRNDASYNKALGRAFLDSQLERYDGNNILALAAYNAGPGRVDKWLKRFGDPRAGEISNEEFIRQIPFRETQIYVATILQGSTPTLNLIPSRSKTTKAQQFEFKDKHPGFTFAVAVRSSYGSQSKWIGGL